MGGAKSGWARVGGLLRRVDGCAVFIPVQPCHICGHEYDQNREYLSNLKRLLSSTIFESIGYSEGIN